MQKIVHAFLYAFVLVIALIITPSPTRAFDIKPLLVPDKTGGGYAADRLIVRFKDYKDTTSINPILKTFEGQARRRIGDTRSFIIDVKPSKRETLRKTLLRNKRVEKVMVDHAYPAAGGPSDPYYSSQWHLDAVHAPDAWGYTTGESSFKIAILDSGIDAAHPDLADKVLTGWNVQNQNTDTDDQNGHGTEVAGVVAATLNNAEGGAGVAPSVALVPIKITINDSKYTFSSAIAEGFAYAQGVGAQVANVSFHLFAGDEVINESAAAFVKAGGMIFVSSGNDGQHYGFKDNPYFIDVSATSMDGQFATFSSHGPFVDIAAPGVNILTTTLNNEYIMVQGTSFASPIVAATAALVWSANPSLTNAEVETDLKQTAHDLGNAGRDDATGFGLVDAGAAVAAVATEKPKTKNAPLFLAPLPSTTTSTLPLTIIPSITKTPSGLYMLQLQIASANIKVDRVDYFDGNTRVASLTAAPYTLQWTPHASSDQATSVLNLKAQAYTDDGVYTMNISIRIQKERAAAKTQASATTTTDSSTLSTEKTTQTSPARTISTPSSVPNARTEAVVESSAEQRPAAETQTSATPEPERQTVTRPSEFIREAPPKPTPARATPSRRR